MTVPLAPGSDGLIRPLNAPPAHQVLPGVQPGVSGAVVLASYVIIFGSASGGAQPGMFIYAAGTSPGPGNPPIFSVSNATQDPYGNAIAPGIWAGSFGGVQAGLTILGSLGQVVMPTGDPNEDLAGGMASALSASNRSFTQVFGPQGHAPTNDRTIMTFFGGLTGTPGALWEIVYNSLVTSNAILQLSGDFSGVTIAGVESLAAVLPGTGTSTANPMQPETWHTATLINGWAGSGSGVNGLRYRIAPWADEIEIEADIINTTATGNSICFNLPAGWQSSTSRNRPASWNNPQVNNSASAPWVFVNGAAVQLNGIEVANKEIFFHVFIPR